jgi:hypothetical protein
MNNTNNTSSGNSDSNSLINPFGKPFGAPKPSKTDSELKRLEQRTDVLCKALNSFENGSHSQLTGIKKEIDTLTRNVESFQKNLDVFVITLEKQKKFLDRLRNAAELVCDSEDSGAIEFEAQVFVDHDAFPRFSAKITQDIADLKSVRSELMNLKHLCAVDEMIAQAYVPKVSPKNLGKLDTAMRHLRSFLKNSTMENYLQYLHSMLALAALGLGALNYFTAQSTLGDFVCELAASADPKTAKKASRVV